MIIGDYFKNHSYVHNELTELMFTYDLDEKTVRDFLGCEHVSFRWLLHSKELPVLYKRLVLILRCLIVCGYDLKMFLDNIKLVGGVPF